MLCPIHHRGRASHVRVLLSSFLLLAVVLAAPAAAELVGHRVTSTDAELPAASGLWLERLDDGSSRLAVTWNDGDVGEHDVLRHRGVLFRDDGRGADDHAGDGLFHAIVRIDIESLTAKFRAETAAADAGATLVDYQRRVKLGTSEIVPFDLAGYLAGERVEVHRGAWVTASGADEARGAHKVTPGTNPFQEDVLIIRRAPVINDPLRTFDPCTGAGTPMGPWTFGHLMNEMAISAGVPTPAFVNNWVQHWMVPQLINSFNVPARPAINAWLGDWQAAGGGVALDPSIAPLRLLAILPRLDLRRGYSGTGTPSGGEVRFVFGAVVPAGWPSNGSFPGPILGGGCQLLPFTVIFEYGVPLSACSNLITYANDWISLAGLGYGSGAYFAKLDSLVNWIPMAGADPSTSTGNALNQLRTNSNAFAPIWELREFHLDPGGLVQTTTADTPHDSFNNTPVFANYVNSTIRPVPLNFGGGPFRGANPLVPFPGFHWDEATLLTGPRHDVSLATCNGCHGGETGTPFVHIDPVTPIPAALSPFMTGLIGFPDPAGSGVLRDFDSLEDREADINALAGGSCVLWLPEGGEDAPTSLVAGSVAGEDEGISFLLEDLLREPPRFVH